MPEADEDEDDMPLSTRLSIADTLTLGNAICGFMAVYFTTTGVLIPHLTGNEDGGMARHSAAMAVILMLLASVFDLFDGMVARKLRASAMGAELDNLSDLISFGLAPAYFVVTWGMVAQDANQRVSVVAAVVVLLAVVLRLARFSCVPMRDGIFQGMPGPFGALTVVAIVLLELPFVPTLLAIVGVAWLMVSRVEYPAAGAARGGDAQLDRAQHGHADGLGAGRPRRPAAAADRLRPAGGPRRDDPAVRDGPEGEHLPRQPPRVAGRVPRRTAPLAAPGRTTRTQKPDNAAGPERILSPGARGVVPVVVRPAAGRTAPQTRKSRASCSAARSSSGPASAIQRAGSGSRSVRA